MSQTESQVIRFEIIAVVFTGLLKFLLVDFLSLKFIYVVGAVLFWAAYLVFKKSKIENVFTLWGFNALNLRKSFYACSVFGIIALGAMFFYARYNGSLHFSWHMIPILLLYPVWGIIQQFLMMCLIAGNLSKMNISKPLIVFFTSFMFSIVHFPSIVLVIGTFFLAIFYSLLYLKYRNIWPLGLFHGWVGCFFFYWVLERDPWIEFGLMLQ